MAEFELVITWTQAYYTNHKTFAIVLKIRSTIFSGKFFRGQVFIDNQSRMKPQAPILSFLLDHQSWSFTWLQFRNWKSRAAKPGAARHGKDPLVRSQKGLDFSPTPFHVGLHRVELGDQAPVWRPYNRLMQFFQLIEYCQLYNTA